MQLLSNFMEDIYQNYIMMLRSSFVSDFGFKIIGYQPVSALLFAITWRPVLRCDTLGDRIYALQEDIGSRIYVTTKRMRELPGMFESVRQSNHRRFQARISAG